MPKAHVRLHPLKALKRRGSAADGASVATKRRRREKAATSLPEPDAEASPPDIAEASGEESRKKKEVLDAEVVRVSSFPGLSELTVQTLSARGITELFEVQHRAFGPIRTGQDVVGRAKTGCGKTLAFVLPLVERILGDRLCKAPVAGRKPLSVLLAPTRELAKQIQRELSAIAEPHHLRVTCVYGGTPFGPQVDEVRAGLDFLVATPGRLIDHLKRGTVSLEAVRFTVLDEADEMLSMGFQEDVEEILSCTAKDGQKLLFSATMPSWVKSLVAKHLRKDHVVIDVVGKGAENQTNENITHECISCSPPERGDTLADLCKVHAGAFGKTLVFTCTKKECDELAQHPTLAQLGAAVLHGDIPQNAREVAMENFRNGHVRLLIATDVAARGLDVPSVDLVVMTHPPSDFDTYVHRSGRTARAGRKGTCVTFYSRNEEYMLRLLQHKHGLTIKRRGPAQPAEIVRMAASDAVRQLDLIHQDNVEAFSDLAKELLDDRGSPVFLLAAAMAAMTGYTQRIKCRSLLTSYEGNVAMLLESDRGIETTSKAWYLLRENVPAAVSASARAMAVVKSSRMAIFDVPQEQVQMVLSAKPWKGVAFSVAKFLPELEAHPQACTKLEDDWKRHSAWQTRRQGMMRWGRAGDSSKAASRPSGGRGGGRGIGQAGGGRGRGRGSH